jgi:FHS family L-fucose permease-like MFS transporter
LRDEVPEAFVDDDSSRLSHFRLLKNPHLLFTICAQFFYVGAQVGTWSYFIQYVQDYTGQPEKVAGYFLTGTLAMFGIGRFASAAVMKYVSPARLMGAYCLMNILLLLAAILHPGWVGVWAIFLTSFFMSLMYPTIFALGLQGLGADSKVGGSFIVMAIIGGAILTPAMGIISDHLKSLAIAYVIPLFSYFTIAGYALYQEMGRFQPSPGPLPPMPSSSIPSAEAAIQSFAEESQEES